MLLFLIFIRLASSKLLLVFNFINNGNPFNANQINANLAASNNYSQILHKNLLYIGYNTRQKYIHNQAFLSEHYNHSEIIVRSSDINQTINNGYIFLTGLYPIKTGPFLNKNFPLERAWPPYNNITFEDNLQFDALPNKFQPIPIHNNNFKEDFIFNSNNLCPTFKLSIKEQKNSSQYHLNKEKAISISKKLFIDINKTINASYEKNFELEDVIYNISFENYNVSQTFVLNNLATIREMLKLTSDCGNNRQLELILSNFLIYFKEIIQNKIRNPEKNLLKYVVLFGEEQMMFSLVSLFNLSSANCQLDLFEHQGKDFLNCVQNFSKIGSQLSLELYSNENNSNIDAKYKYYMKILYNGKKMNLFEKDRYEVSLNEIKAYIDKFILTDFKKMCQNQEEKKISNSNFMKNKKLQEAENEIEANYEFITALIILETILIIVVSILIYFRRKKLI